MRKFTEDQEFDRILDMLDDNLPARRVKEGQYPPEVALRGKSKNQDGRLVSWKTQWEGGSYNDGAILVVMKKRYRISTYEAQDRQAIERRVAHISSLDESTSRVKEGSFERRLKLLTDSGVSEEDAIQAIKDTDERYGPAYNEDEEDDEIVFDPEYDFDTNDFDFGDGDPFGEII